MHRITLPLVLALVVVSAGCSSVDRSRNLANPAVSGKTLAQQVCSNCHGPDGNSVSPNFPNLAQQQAEYIKIQLDGFRKHSRIDPAGFEYMWGLSHNLTDKQIGELADYFSAQKIASPGPGKAAAAARGKKIFEEGVASQKTPPCKSCHGPDGMGDGQFPRIAYQHADYIMKQLNVFQRTNERPEGPLMKTVAHTLTKQDIRDVAQYLQGMTTSG